MLFLLYYTAVSFSLNEQISTRNELPQFVVMNSKQFMNKVLGVDCNCTGFIPVFILTDGLVCVMLCTSKGSSLTGNVNKMVYPGIVRFYA